MRFTNPIIAKRDRLRSAGLRVVRIVAEKKHGAGKRKVFFLLHDGRRRQITVTVKTDQEFMRLWKAVGKP